MEIFCPIYNIKCRIGFLDDCSLKDSKRCIKWRDKIKRNIPLSFNEQLNKKAQDFNLTKKDIDNVSIRNNRQTKIIRKGGEKMITSRGALDDYEAICKEDIDASAKLVKIFKIVIKLLLGIRTNQVGGVKRDLNPTPKPSPKE